MADLPNLDLLRLPTRPRLALGSLPQFGLGFGHPVNSLLHELPHPGLDLMLLRRISLRSWDLIKDVHRLHPNLHGCDLNIVPKLGCPQVRDVGVVAMVGGHLGPRHGWGHQPPSSPLEGG